MRSPLQKPEISQPFSSLLHFSINLLFLQIKWAKFFDNIHNEHFMFAWISNLSAGVAFINSKSLKLPKQTYIHALISKLYNQLTLHLVSHLSTKLQFNPSTHSPMVLGRKNLLVKLLLYPICERSRKEEGRTKRNSIGLDLKPK